MPVMPYKLAEITEEEACQLCLYTTIKEQSEYLINLLKEYKKTDSYLEGAAFYIKAHSDYDCYLKDLLEKYPDLKEKSFIFSVNNSKILIKENKN